MNIKKEAIIGDNLYVGHMIASGDSRMKKKGGRPLRDQGKSRCANINIYLAW